MKAGEEHQENLVHFTGTIGIKRFRNTVTDREPMLIRLVLVHRLVAWQRRCHVDYIHYYRHQQQ
jgi:hypothetical protein